MANTYTQIYIHAIFAVEGRQCLINPEHNDELQKTPPSSPKSASSSLPRNSLNSSSSKTLPNNSLPTPKGSPQPVNALCRLNRQLFDSKNIATIPRANSATNIIPNASNAKPTNGSKPPATFTAPKNSATPMTNPISPTATSSQKTNLQTIPSKTLLLPNMRFALCQTSLPCLRIMPR